ncbi:Uncharacterized protein DBV15_05801 [Temnothorax longispinosus]|uniref:Uncharacterized protein n=1 Tax=Temnothorax longispinosus TaxID=300112 RepID=A0A4S2L3Q8_9HYME|nr:Uncharacterized protein DBV15_05801 [Temnothorax longispinosus]
MYVRYERDKILTEASRKQCFARNGRKRKVGVRSRQGQVIGCLTLRRNRLLRCQFGGQINECKYGIQSEEWLYRTRTKHTQPHSILDRMRRQVSARKNGKLFRAKDARHESTGLRDGVGGDEYFPEEELDSTHQTTLALTPGLHNKAVPIFIELPLCRTGIGGSSSFPPPIFPASNGVSTSGGDGDGGVEMRTTAMVVAAAAVVVVAAGFPSGSIFMYVYLWARVTSYAALPTPLWDGTTETYEPKARGRADADTAPKGYSAQCEKVALTGPVRLYTRRPETHTRAHLEIRLREYTRGRARLFVCSHFNGGMEGCRYVRDARYPTAVPLYPANWNFSPRIEFFRENHETPARAIYATSWASRCAGALYIHNVIHQNMVMRPIVYRRSSESPRTYFPKRNGNANDLSATRRTAPRYIVIDAGHHRIDVPNVGGCSDH